jgi:hypothetical protein
MYIQVEIKEGSIAFGVCPVELAKDGKTPVQNLVLGRVTKIENKANKGLGEREITITTDHDEVAISGVGPYVPSPDEYFTVTLPEWRVSEFDFGGVPMNNPWFDPLRIEAEDTKKIGFNPHQRIQFP